MNKHNKNHKTIDVKKINATSTVDLIVEKVVKSLSPKIDEAFDKIRKEFRSEIKEVRESIVSSNSTGKDQSKAVPTISDALNQLGIIQNGSQPSPLVDGSPAVQGGATLPQNPMILELLKLFLQPQQSAGIGGQSMNEVILRDMIATKNFQNSIMKGATMQMMKQAGLPQSEISQMEKTNSAIMDPLLKYGEKKEKQDALIKAGHIVNDK